MFYDIHHLGHDSSATSTSLLSSLGQPDWFKPVCFMPIPNGILSMRDRMRELYQYVSNKPPNDVKEE